MFCKHKWKVLSETTTKSEIELLIEVVPNMHNCKGYSADRKFIQIVTCEKCGKLHRFVEDI